MDVHTVECIVWLQNLTQHECVRAYLKFLPAGRQVGLFRAVHKVDLTESWGVV